MNLFRELSILVALTLLNGVFAGAEIAMLSVRKTRLKELAEDGAASAALALQLRQDTERLLATVQIGISVVGAAAAVFGGTHLAAPLAHTLRTLGVSEYADQLGFVGVVALVSYLSLVLGELVPKSLALQRSERFALLVARGLYVLSKAVRPLVWLLVKSSNLVLWPLRDRTTFSEARLSPDELQQLIEEAATSGALHRELGEVVSRALDLGSLAVHAVMVPRTRIVALPKHGTRGELLQLLRRHRHARYPIASEQGEEYAGYVVARELLERLAQYPHASELDIVSISRDAPLFREHAPAIEVLRRLQASRAPLGLVIDEHGSVAGLVTIEDLAEEVFGEILEEDEVLTPAIERESETTVVVRGDTPLQELSRELDLDVEPRTGTTTVAGLVIDAAGRIPLAGERVELFPGLEAEVLESTVRQVRSVRLHLTRRAERSLEAE